ncbi:HypC/HybG/HupF family hydrogenase formation chaperone [Acerihabitans sp. TG2]|uniref:HypC/HybG/HupF family hydrogenase formation chaperone n=1 Tax=Acerihabitans sp. TG2 TaxID=3096008 RepID=UPI002B226245|nr:HypC/HybG/HupF family hydrogenase formation chaperone [Acerihabitans sp. TG2]MEA9391351.1 HypC/HybG/HupF family hydrogenase formation chaperone [Acerihabitans sp. TG2]
MCIGIPGQVITLDETSPGNAWVDVCGVKRRVNVRLVCADAAAMTALPGQWVLVHVGFAMSLLDESEAKETLDALRQMGEMEPDVGLFLQGGESHAVR